MGCVESKPHRSQAPAYRQPPSSHPTPKKHSHNSIQYRTRTAQPHHNHSRRPSEESKGRLNNITLEDNSDKREQREESYKQNHHPNLTTNRHHDNSGCFRNLDNSIASRNLDTSVRTNSSPPPPTTTTNSAHFQRQQFDRNSILRHSKKRSKRARTPSSTSMATSTRSPSGSNLDRTITLSPRPGDDESSKNKIAGESRNTPHLPTSPFTRELQNGDEKRVQDVEERKKSCSEKRKTTSQNHEQSKLHDMSEEEKYGRLI